MPLPSAQTNVGSSNKDYSYASRHHQVSLYGTACAVDMMH